jgi:hypothetical protein
MKSKFAQSIVRARRILFTRENSMYISGRGRVHAAAIAGILLTWLACPPAAADSINLVQNGGFETGNFTGWTLVPGSNSIVAQAGQIPGLGPHSGTYFAALEENPPNPYAILSQIISDTSGQPLQLAFSYASAGSCIHCQVFVATWNSSDPFHNVVFVDNRSGAYPYQTVAGTVIGTGSDVVTFFAQSLISNDSVVTPSFIALDDVSLSVVPGPIAGAGLPGAIAACAGLLAWWRRRQRIV